MKNYYNLINSQIQTHEENVRLDDLKTELEKQWQDDVDFEKQELEKKYVEERYYGVFVDRFLANLIELIIKQIKNKSNIEDKYCIELIYSHNHSVNPYDIKYDCAYISLVAPSISSDPLQIVTSYYDDSGILDDLNKNLETFCRHISFYSEISISDTSIPINNILGKVTRSLEKKIISFECTLKELINMYYMEKQRQAHENYDARKIRKNR